MKIYTLILCLVPVTGLIYILSLFKRLNLKEGGEPLHPDYNTKRFMADLKRSIDALALIVANIYLSIKILDAIMGI